MKAPAPAAAFTIHFSVFVFLCFVVNYCFLENY